MSAHDPVNILLVDDHPAKLLSYEVMLSELGENLIKASSAREAMELLLKRDIAVVLSDVSMPEMDGFDLADMLREHPRFENTAIIFVSALHLDDLDRLRGFKLGAVDYITVPVAPELLRAKVKVVAELYRKTRQLKQLNEELACRGGSKFRHVRPQPAHGRTLCLTANEVDARLRPSCLADA
jgi:PleD family two-component response regulator